MTMTSASAQYFDQIAGQWDQLRSGYFTEAVRKAAIQKAYLRSDMDVADVGAGTGFMSAGLAKLVHKVNAFDGSPAMLAVASQNLKEFDNIVFHEAEGLSLPLPDASLDAVFANMYLHHWTIWDLLEAEKHTGIGLTESYAMYPGASVSGLYFAHAEGKYFAVGKLNRDQLVDYHGRKGLTLPEVERWLGPYLNYEPAKTSAPAAAELLARTGVEETVSR